MKKKTTQEIVRRLAEDFDTKLKRIEGDFLTKLNCISFSVTTIQQQLDKLSDEVYGSKLPKITKENTGLKDVVDDIQANGAGDYGLEVSDVFEETGGYEGSDDNAEEACINEGELFSSNKKEEIKSSKPTNSVRKGVIKTCKECDAQVSSRRQLVNHMVNVHGQERAFKCDRCPKQFSDRYTFRKHNETLHRDRSQKQKYYCDVCPKVLTTKSGLTAHKLVHTGEKPYECDICSNQFRQRNSLIHHMRTHTKERPYMCHECSKTFGSRNSFRLHMQTHLGIKPFKCTFIGCVWAFVQKSKLAVHMQSHTGERPVICPICQKGYSKRYHVRKHIKNFHKIEDVDGVLGSKRRPYEAKPEAVTTDHKESTSI